MLTGFMKGVDWINEWAGKILYPAQLLICLVVFIEIFLRYLFNHPTLWSYETTLFIFIICTMFSAGHLSRENGQINVDILYSKFSPRTKLIVDICTFPFFLLFIGAMTWYGFEFALDSIGKLETTGSVWDPPVYPIKFAVPLGALLLLLQGIVNLIRQIQSYRTGIPDSTERSEDLDIV